MFNMWILIAGITVTGSAAAQQLTLSDCDSNGYRCGDERITGRDDRPRPSIVQPKGERLASPCDGVIDPTVSFRAQINGVRCGEGAVAKDRLPLAVDKKVLRDWDVRLRSNIPRAQYEMQEIRKATIKWEGEIAFPMEESWSYDVLKGNFADHCPKEQWSTTCAREIERLHEWQEEVDDTDNCLEWETVAESSSSSGSGGIGSSPDPGSSSYSGNRGTHSDSNGHEERLKKHGQGAADRYLDSIEEDEAIEGVENVDAKRDPAGRRCVKYGKKKITKREWRSAGTVSYSCMKTRNSWCTWYEKETVVRSCKPHQAKFELEYAKDPNWNPDYTHPEKRERDYHYLLPNKWELLPGESERVYIFANTGRDSTLAPAIKFDSKWNDYKFEVSPRNLRCEFGMNPTLKFQVHTIGRIKNKSPNLLAVPNGADGTTLNAFGNNGESVHDLPVKMELVDPSRKMMLQASRHSQIYPRPDAARERDEKGIYKELKNEEEVGTAQSLGFWVDTRFKVQMFKYGKLKQLIRMTPAMKYASQELNVFGDFVTFHLQDTEFYRAAGPFESMLGSVWQAFGVELSPGHKYTMKVQTSQTGLPFYHSGCGNGDDACLGEEVDDKVFGEPIYVDFEGSEQVRRSFFRWMRDVRQFFNIF